MNAKFYLPVVTCLLLLSSCIKDKTDITLQHYTPEQYAVLARHLDLPEYPHNYDVWLPEHLGGFVLKKRNDLAILGRVLFYDKRLSKNDNVSCASCHRPELAFADDAAFSKGFAGELTSRNSLSLGSVINFESYSFKTPMFWDHRAGSIMDQSRETIENPIEMGMKLSALSDKLLQEEYYRVLFEKAFGAKVFEQKNKEFFILRALQEFIGSIGAFNTKFDQGFQKHRSMSVDFSNFTTEENQGKSLFIQHCQGCHTLDNLAFDNSKEPILAANNGLDLKYADNGIGAFTHSGADWDVFKVPQLRNIALTAPYMHDGRFTTLEQVVAHYNSGIQNHPNLHPLLKSGSEPKHLNLTEQEQQALVAFLNTLTDQASCLQEKYVNPFK